MKQEELNNLLKEFSQTFPLTPKGQQHIKAYKAQREQGQKNFQEIEAQVQEGQDITDAVLLKLLPHTKTAKHQELDAWIHIAPCITGDIKTWYESSGWTKPEDWPQIAKSIFAFIAKSREHPNKLDELCLEFANYPYSKGFQTGMITPLLNALDPDRFLLVNNKSRAVINYFSGTNYSQKLTDYPKANQAGQRLIQDIRSELLNTGIGDLRPEDIFDMFCHWLVSINKFKFQDTRYWKISPGENACQWYECLEQGFIGLGWNELGDVSALSRAEFDDCRDRIIAKHPEKNWTKNALNQVRVFSEIRAGDRIIANRGTTEVLGIGTVVGTYYFEPDSPQCHQLSVKWDDVNPRQVNEGGWRKTLIGLDPDKFNMILDSPGLKTISQLDSKYPFTEKAFDLLAKLNAEPRSSIYKSNRDEFQEFLIQPFQKLMRQVAKQLPKPITDRMEIERRLFAQITKNDYGQGNAWDFYWGAFYPKGQKRTESAQLFLWMNHDRVEAGFFMGVYGQEQRKQFLKHCQNNSELIAQLLEKTLSGSKILFGVRNLYAEGAYDNFKLSNQADIAQAIQSLASDDVHIARVFPKQVALQMTQADFEKVILETYQKVFPFVLLATEDKPLPEIQSYLASSNDDQTTQTQLIPNSTQIYPVGIDAPDTNPEYNPKFTLADCASHLHMDESILARYLHALERKKQAIFYGPPGTGKTYLAHALAKHLLSESHGFREVVQFHPTFAYEDFIQGIRPKQVEGGLDYPIVPGRFLSFCHKAEQRSSKDLCILIIDEINRANLSQVFGELMYALEYRDEPIQLAAGETFRIPPNVRLIGTMNTADRSIALVDHALRRRFAFLHVPPNYALLQKFHQNTGFIADGLIQTLKNLNQHIGDRNYEIGPSFFLHEDLAEHLESIWITEIEPYLEEYFFDQANKVEQFTWNQVQKIIGI